MKIFILVSLLITPLLSQTTGFIAGTTVQTPQGFIPIEDLKSNDRVICYVPGEIGFYALIKNKSSYSASRIVYIVFEDLTTGEHELIGAAADQLFYVAFKEKWIKAKNLIVGNRVLTRRGFARVGRVDIDAESVIFYKLSFKEHHTYCVSDIQVIVHS